jgi:hypothetical protein
VTNRNQQQQNNEQILLPLPVFFAAMPLSSIIAFNMQPKK